MMAITHFPLDYAELDFTEFPCPNCQSCLDFHIPDPDMPDRLLGTCEECKSWFLMDTNRGEMVSLPVEEFFEGAPVNDRSS